MRGAGARQGWTAKGLVCLASGLGLIAACSSSSGTASAVDAATSPDVAKAITQLGAGDWANALASCLAAESANGDATPDASTTADGSASSDASLSSAGVDGGALGSDCDARYCELVARSMLVVDQINSFLLPRYRRPLTAMPGDIQNLAKTNTLLNQAIASAETVTSRQCEFDLPHLPLLMGDTTDPILSGDVRGVWTTRDAHILAALFDSMSYGLQAEFNPQAVPAPPPGETVPALPPLLDSMRQHLLAQDALLISEPADVSDPASPRGGWLDRNGNGKPDSPDELLIDIFTPGTMDRVFDYSTAEFVRSEALPLDVLTPTASLPAAKCKYQQSHIDTVASGSNVTSTDGMSFSPDGTQIAIPLLENGNSEIHTAKADGTSPTCITCGQGGNNDGVRWRPNDPNTLIFISDRDHPDATGNAGGGFGQELYAMHADGSQPTRLTQSHIWATNYHVNWSPDGMHVVWGRTEARSWDVMVADFTVDASGAMSLTSTRTLIHDTTWWETHGFTADNQYVITTNTRAGFQSTDIYAVDIMTGARKRLTNDNAWDEHAHLSPDGREMAWISGRWHPASVLRLNDGTISPTYDFLWIIPGIFFEFLNPPAGYASELTLMDADGSNTHALTNDQQVVADSEWSFDGTKIIFRQTNPTDQTTRIRVLTFDDCQ